MKNKKNIDYEVIELGSCITILLRLISFGTPFKITIKTMLYYIYFHRRRLCSLVSLWSPVRQECWRYRTCHRRITQRREWRWYYNFEGEWSFILKRNCLLAWNTIFFKNLVFNIFLQKIKLSPKTWNALFCYKNIHFILARRIIFQDSASENFEFLCQKCLKSA